MLESPSIFPSFFLEEANRSLGAASVIFLYKGKESEGLLVFFLTERNSGARISKSPKCYFSKR